jgi:hypothetical protein
MQVRSNIIHINRKTFFLILLTLLTFAVATPVLADYLGPDRTVTETTSVSKIVLYECGYVPSKGDWRYHKVDEWPASNESKPWLAYPSDPSSMGCFERSNASEDKYWQKEEVVQEITTTYPPATISSSLQNCTLNNGWCVTAPELLLNGTEPIIGQSILAIEGALNGQSFACSGATCNVPLSEGNNVFTFWALSSWGDSSEMGTFTAQVDTVAPNVGLDVGGSNGTNGWFVSPTIVTATGSDSTSGLQSVLLSVDNGVWLSSTTLNDGVHTVTVQAQDNAGNISTSSTTISVDTTTPSIDISTTGTLGANGCIVRSCKSQRQPMMRLRVLPLWK